MGEVGGGEVGLGETVGGREGLGEVGISVRPDHLFRYPSEWDPRQAGQTKGGYLQGHLQLPRVAAPLRLLLSTSPAEPPAAPHLAGAHPALLHVVRKGRGNRRDQDKEPVPNKLHWQQEFLVRGGRLTIRNKTSVLDSARCARSGMAPIPATDDMLAVRDDMRIGLGREAGQLKLIILSPKTEKRASGEEVSLTTILATRLEPDQVPQAVQLYTGRNSANLKRVRLRLEVFREDTGELLGAASSLPISDTASKAHGALDLRDATPLLSCARGGRKVVLVSEFSLAADVEPRFQLLGADGARAAAAEEALVRQPGEQAARTVEVLRETIVFLTPEQPHAERLLAEGWRLELVARRRSDGRVSRARFPFHYLPHDYYKPCPFCELGVDGLEEPAALAPPRVQTRPGLRKRKMSGEERRDGRVGEEEAEAANSSNSCLQISKETN